MNNNNVLPRLLYISIPRTSKPTKTKTTREIACCMTHTTLQLRYHYNKET